MNRSLLGVCLILVPLVPALIGCASETSDTPRHEILPETAPTSQPQLVAPGFISTGLYERDAAFSPDGNEFYYTLWTGQFGVIVTTRREESGWTEPLTASFSGRFSDIEPFVTPAGDRLFFASNRPLGQNDESGNGNYNIWFVEREGDKWGEPQPLPGLVNTDVNEFYPTLDRNGTLYFTAAYRGSLGGEDIFRSVPTDSGYGTPENLGPGVNSERDEFNSLIAPDGSYLVFSSFGREDGHGGGDIYVSHVKEDGSFGDAFNLGAEVNSTSLDFCPALTPDGRTLIFSSRRTEITPGPDSSWTYQELAEVLSRPGNGESDLYLVPASVLDVNPATSGYQVPTNSE